MERTNYHPRTKDFVVAPGCVCHIAPSWLRRGELEGDARVADCVVLKQHIVHAAGHLRANLERTAAIAKASEGVGAGCGLYQVVARVNVDSWASMGPADCIAPCIPTQHKCSVRCVRHNLSVSSDWPLLRSSLIIKPISNQCIYHSEICQELETQIGGCRQRLNIAEYFSPLLMQIASSPEMMSLCSTRARLTETRSMPSAFGPKHSPAWCCGPPHSPLPPAQRRTQPSLSLLLNGARQYDKTGSG